MSDETMPKCVNGDGRPVARPSRVLCQECMDAVGKRLEQFANALAAKEPDRT